MFSLCHIRRTRIGVNIWSTHMHSSACSIVLIRCRAVSEVIQTGVISFKAVAGVRETCVISLKAVVGLKETRY